MPELQAILWDHDGTLVETEPYWIEAEFDLAARTGAQWTQEDAIGCVGSDMRESAHRMQQAGVGDMTIDEIVEWLVDRVAGIMQERGILYLPGVQQIFAECQQQGIRCAVVSNAWRKVVEMTVSGLPEGVVEYILAGDEMVHAKPDPWPYAHAADVLGVSRENCVAIEDSLAGTLSAEAAGIAVVVVKGVQPVPAGPKRSRVFDLAEVHLDTLRSVVNGAQYDLAEVAE